MLPASWMLTATSYLGDTGVFRILAVLATVLAIAFSHTQASPMCALFIVCHTLPPCCLDLSSSPLLSSMLEPQHWLVKHVTAQCEQRPCAVARLK